MRNGSPIYIVILLLLGLGFALAMFPGDAWAETEQKSVKKIREPFKRFDIEFEPLDGIHLVGSKKKIYFKIGGRMHLDGGSVNEHDGLNDTFPDLGEDDVDFRRVSITLLGLISDFMALKLEVDFSDIRNIKDNWISIWGIPFLDLLKIGHFKEPYSLEELTGSDNFTFMERALPTEAFRPGRNLGFLCQNAILKGRMLWAFGGFLEVSSTKDLENPTDRIDDASGYNLTARLTGLPWYVDKGKKLFHLGLSVSNKWRDEDDQDDLQRLSTNPESFIADERLVDTGLFFADAGYAITPEFAFVHGPYSLQGEYFHVSLDSDEADDPTFWGLYLYMSYFITGEVRPYNMASGAFKRVIPKRNFDPRKRGWGAWEMGFRFSYIDLNDAGIDGGEELNLTLGLNWYVHPKIRMMFNYVHARIDDREAPRIRNAIVDIVASRFQVVF